MGNFMKAGILPRGVWDSWLLGILIIFPGEPRLKHETRNELVTVVQGDRLCDIGVVFMGPRFANSIFVS